jgi:hypothetical protein
MTQQQDNNEEDCKVVYEVTTVTDRKGNKSTTSTGNRLAASRSGADIRFFTKTKHKTIKHADGSTTRTEITTTYERPWLKAEGESLYTSPQHLNLERNITTEWEKPVWTGKQLRPTGVAACQNLEKPITSATTNKKPSPGLSITFLRDEPQPAAQPEAGGSNNAAATETLAE